jgi:hypothetical protein
MTENPALLIEHRHAATTLRAHSISKGNREVARTNSAGLATSP